MRLVVVASRIVPGRSAGIEHFAYGLIRAIAKVDGSVRLTVVIPRGREQPWKQRVGETDRVQLEPVQSVAGISAWAEDRVGSRRWKRAKISVRKLAVIMRVLELMEQTQLRRVLERLSPAVVYYPFHLQPIDSKFGWFSVVTVHDLKELQPHLGSASAGKVLKANIETAAGLVVSWPHPFHQLIGTFPQVKGKTFLVPFPPAMVASSESSSSEGNTGRMGQGDVVLYVSSTAPHKNHLSLIRAMELICKRRPGRRINLICVGPLVSPSYDEALAEASRLGLRDRIQFTGFVTDSALTELYRQASLVVVPTLWEAASGAVYEAWAFGKPVACSRIPPLVEQVEQAGAKVRFFNPLDPAEIAEAVLEVLDYPEPYLEGALAGRAFVRRLRWEKTAEQYLNVFRCVARRRRKRTQIPEQE